MAKYNIRDTFNVLWVEGLTEKQKTQVMRLIDALMNSSSVRLKSFIATKNWVK